jgi:hypothetical protein
MPSASATGGWMPSVPTLLNEMRDLVQLETLVKAWERTLQQQATQS